MRVWRADGLTGADTARGLVVVIDVLRAFTVSAYAFASGAGESLLVSEISAALALHDAIPGSIVSAEVGGRPVAGVPISNSPSQLRELDLRGRTLIQRTSAGTQAVARATNADQIFAASLVVAGATARAVETSGFEEVTLVASGSDEGHLEDIACADYIEALLEGRRPDADSLLKPLRASARYAALAAGRQLGFPSADLELSLVADRFDFAQRVIREDGLLKLRPIRAGA